MTDHPGVFTIVRCRGCGLRYQSPRPANLTPFYQGAYYAFDSRDDPASASQPNALTGLAAVYARTVQRVVSSGSGTLLDIGCADGSFLAAMAQLGWDVYGVEPDETAARRANSRLPMVPPRVLCGILEDADYPGDHFDLITLWHVIEHLPSPLATLREVRRLLRPRGRVIMLTPRWGSLESLLFGRYWSGLDLPRHLWFFTDRSLQALIERAGMTIVQRLHLPGYDQLSLSILFLLRGWFGKDVAMIAFRLMHAPLVKRAGLRAISLVDSLGLGTQMVYVAERP
ncbi:MAG: class I SAM-dependent methyltransferase [Roseiflexaceae bacterium]|nr:class I SAM-dependent methyltransferase [Roseiflexus sp.]MDW8234249.1 class I SAM-dependent methyltransferase [Roseiflexaceae bacterium]